ASRDSGSTDSTASFTLGSGVTTATFADQALGMLAICTNAADASTANQTFQLSALGSAPISVKAGQCSPSIRVPAGPATVLELARPTFSLSFVQASDSRLLSGPFDNPATVAVPFGGTADETVVTFTNGVDTGQFTLCQQSPEPSLQDTPFTLSVTYVVNGVTTSNDVSLMPGQCSALSADIPVVDADGNPIEVDVSEAPIPTVQVSDIALDGAGTVGPRHLTAGTAPSTTPEGIPTPTYTNVRTPVVPDGRS